MKLSISTETFRYISIALTIVILLLVSAVAVSAVYADRIVAGTQIGDVAVGNLSRDEAFGRLQERLDELSRNGFAVQIGAQYEAVLPESVGMDLNIAEAVDLAYERGHAGTWWQQGLERFSALWRRERLRAPVFIDEVLLGDRVDELGQLSDVARKDIRLSVTGTRIDILTDTRPGKVVDRSHARQTLAEHIRALRNEPFSVLLVDDLPRASALSAQEAKRQAERMISSPLYLSYEDLTFTITRTVLASWLLSEYEADRLVPGVNRKAAAQYVTRIADQLNVAPEPAGVTTEDGLITGFTPPQYGRAVREDETVEHILALLDSRRPGSGGTSTIVVSMRQTKPPEVSLGDGSGITELIGKATTLFTGSPRNRVFNITNGARFLSGVVVKSGEEFSTLEQLGTIDNTTGYLPELVIKGDRTIPEYGGGLCQVSTTLFRAVLDAGLPVTDRRNHSRRVSYYEKDEHGRFIGPGLDATIYDNAPDLKFMNDTGNPILVISYVHGTKITFELYGTKDGRTSNIIGPTMLTEVDPGEPVYIETDELEPGEVKQVEWAIPGGSAVATYVVTYGDGRIEEQEFKSYYRKWPDKFLIGRDPNATPSPGPEAE